MEYKEYINPQEENYDIDSSLLYNSVENNQSVSNNNIEEWEIEEDIFEDKNIEKTLKRYNYDYKSLMRELTTFIDYSELLEILDKCGIKKNEYLNPTYITFEKIRNYIINNGKTR